MANAVTPRTDHPDRTARRLGWASLALGVPQVVAPSAFARALGLAGRADDTTAVTVVGARELVAAGGLLSGRATRLFLWSRVLGDAMDLALLRKAMRDGRRDTRMRVAAAGVAGIAALDVLAAVRHTKSGSATVAPVELTAVTTVNTDPEAAYDEWRALDRLPRFMTHVESVEWLDDRRTRWTAAAPLGTTVTWEAELVDDRRGDRLSWQSLPGTGIENEGSVEFSPAPGGRGTEVRVRLRYVPPGGKAGQAFARLFGEEPHQQVEDDLRRFKQVVETGEIARSSGSPEGHRASRQLFQRPAQPVG